MGQAQAPRARTIKARAELGRKWRGRQRRWVRIGSRSSSGAGCFGAGLILKSERQRAQLLNYSAACMWKVSLPGHPPPRAGVALKSLPMEAEGPARGCWCWGVEGQLRSPSPRSTPTPAPFPASFPNFNYKHPFACNETVCFVFFPPQNKPKGFTKKRCRLCA